MSVFYIFSNKKEKKKLKYLVLLLIEIILMMFCLGVLVAAETNYTIASEKGTQILEVKYYDEITWKNTINKTITPSDWFGGDADKIGAKNKLTTLGWYDSSFGTYSMFADLVIPKETLPLFPIVRDFGYNYTYLDNNYRYNYFIWILLRSEWFFTTKEFDDNPNDTYYMPFIIKNPQDFIKMLDDYNDYTIEINNDTILQSLGYSFPILSGDDLVWQFIIGKLGRFAIATPINDYLTDMVEVLGCKNVTIQNNMLIIKRSGELNFILEVTYNSQGTIDSLTFKNSESSIFYEITSCYPRFISFIILGIIAIFIIGLVIIVFIKKRRFQ